MIENTSLHLVESSSNFLYANWKNFLNLAFLPLGSMTSEKANLGSNVYKACLGLCNLLTNSFDG